MGTFEEIGEIPEKYRVHKESLKLLFKKHDIDGIKALISKYTTNSSFKAEWAIFWSELAKSEGGKLSLTTIGLIIGAALGGVGIAAMGGAIGMPLALVLGLGGFLSGSKFDSLSVFSSEKKVSAKISKDLYLALESKASEYGLTVSEYVKLIIESEVGSLTKQLS